MTTSTTVTPTAGVSEPSRDWYALTVVDALSAQGVDPARGLSTEEANARLARFGPNVFAEAKKEPGWRAFIRQFRDPMQIVLLVAGVISNLSARAGDYYSRRRWCYRQALTVCGDIGCYFGD